MTEIRWNHGGMFVGADSQLKMTDHPRAFTVEWDGLTKTLRVTVDGKDVPYEEGEDSVWRAKEE